MMRKFSLKKFNVEIPETLEECSPNNYEDYLSKKLYSLFQKIPIQIIQGYIIKINYQCSGQISSIIINEGKYN